MQFQEFPSVIIPAHNSSKTIRQAILSCLGQELSDQELEVVVCCDHCTDDTRQVVEEIGDPRIQVVTNEGKPGAANARNTAISAAKGRYLIFLDADDEMLSGRLQSQVSLLRDSSYSLCYGPYYVTKAGEAYKLFVPKKEARFASAAKSMYIGCSTVAIDRKKVPDFAFRNDIPEREDAITWLSLLRIGHQGKSSDEPLSVYYINTSGVSAKKTHMAKRQWTLYRKGLSFSIIRAFVYMCFWAWRGFWKYRIARKENSPKGLIR